MAAPLSHLRVLDLTRVLAGPWCTQMLADLGADVIKVERPRLGDDTRHWGPPWIADDEGVGTGDSAYFASTNRNKKSIAVDISKAEGQALLRSLLQGADVLVENYKVGDLKRYGLSYDDLKSDFPRLVYCSVTGYGQDGPCAHKPGYDFIFQGEGGLMSINGEADDQPGGGPMKTAIAVTDVLTGLNATIAVLAAIEARHANGEGQHIDVSLLDTIVHFASNQVASYFASGQVPRRWGNAHPNLTPYQTCRTSDGYLIIACGNDGQFAKLCGVLQRPDLASDSRFERMSDRNLNRRELIAEIERSLAKGTTAHWQALLEECDVPSGIVNTYDKVFEHPQVKHRQMRVDMQHSTGGVVGTVRNPIRLSATPVECRHAPPLRGEHTTEILSQLLGMSDSRIAALEAAGVVESQRLRR